MTVERHSRLRDVRLYLVASAAGSAPPAGDEPFWRAVREAVDAGVGAVQLRLKACGTDARRAALAHARDLLGQDALLLVNDDLDALFDARGGWLADGVHLGREDAAALAESQGFAGDAVAAGLRIARDRLGPELLLGTSTRTRDEVARALAAGADHAGFGAMASTSTKDGTTRADPAELAACVAAFGNVPLFAIGGMGPATLHLARDAGCRRAAVGAAILGARDVSAAVRACLAALGV